MAQLKSGLTLLRAQHKDTVVYIAKVRKTQQVVAVKLVDRSASADSEPREVCCPSVRARGALNISRGATTIRFEFYARWTVSTTRSALLRGTSSRARIASLWSRNIIRR